MLTFGSAGNGNLTQLIAEVFKRATGIDVVHVPYRAITDAQRDVGAGRVDFMFAISPSRRPAVIAPLKRRLNAAFVSLSTGLLAMRAARCAGVSGR